jgi:hypothetical protein
MRDWDDRSSSRSGTTAYKDNPAGLTSLVVNDSAVGSDLAGRGKGDSEQAKLAKLDWSLGTERHAAGNCTPCCFHNAKEGCSKGINCRFCHAPHVRRHRARPSKNSRLQCKRVAEMFDNCKGQQGIEANVGPPDADTYLAVIGIMCSSEQKYMRSILSARNRQPSRQQAAVGDERPANAGDQAEASPEQASGSAAA